MLNVDSGFSRNFRNTDAWFSAQEPKNKTQKFATVRHMLPNRCEVRSYAEGPRERGQKQKQLKKAPTMIRVIDPFAGDGRLVRWLIEVYSISITPNVNWEVTLWDVNQDGLITAEKEFQNLKSSDRVSLKISQGDAFVKAINDDGEAYLNQFDVVITNPPWEVIKPDHRQIKKIS